MYLAFDPGNTTGWALFDSEGKADSYGQLSLTELMEKCEEWRSLDLTAIIYEDFLVFKHKAPKLTGSRMEVAQAIGVIKTLASAAKCPVIKQPSTIKPIAQKWTQLKPIGAHSQSHWVDAFNHGAYYLIKNNIRESFLESEIKNEPHN